MDFSGELFWVIMLIFYLVFQVLGARKKKQEQQKRRPTRPQPAPTSAEPREGNELDDALAEIRRALGYPDEPEEEPAPAETEARPVEKPLESHKLRDQPTRIPPRVRKEPPKPRRAAPLGGSIYVEEEKAAFALEEAFEQQEEKLPLLDSAVARESAAPHITPPPVGKGKSRLSHIVKRLQSPTSARDAVLMREILGPPRGARRRR